jgi:membrane protein required for colicin V production
MTHVHYVLLAVVALSVIVGTARGFLRESIALLGWLVGLWLSWRYADKLLPYLGGSLVGTELQVWVARSLVLVGVIATAWIIASLLGYFVQRSGLTYGLDRIFGGFFGLVRGVVIIGFGVMLAKAAHLDIEPWWQASKLLPVGSEMAIVLEGYVDSGRRIVQETGMDQP